MKSYIYWLHLPEHTDMKTEGYIGVANNHHKRLRVHKSKALMGTHRNPHLQEAFQKYGDQIEKHVIWLGKEADCYRNEEILRPTENIGWNIDSGGFHSPRTPEIKEKISQTLKGRSKPPRSAEHAKRIVESRNKTLRNMTAAERSRKFSSGKARKGNV